MNDDKDKMYERLVDVACEFPDHYRPTESYKKMFCFFMKPGCLLLGLDVNILYERFKQRIDGIRK